MPNPTIADKKPIGVELDAGEEYYWCACGRSNSQPFCDGSHTGTEFTPEESGEAHLCQCKHTSNPPYCDGTHARLAEGPAGETEGPQAAAPVASVAPTPEEPTVKFIHDLARYGLEKTGHHGQVGAMGVPRPLLPQWDDIQIIVAQFATKPLMDDAGVGTELVIGPNAESRCA